MSKRVAQEHGWNKFDRALQAAKRLRSRITDTQRRQWAIDPIWQWAAESFDMVRQPFVQYCTMQGDKCAYEPGNPLLDRGEKKRTVKMSDRYLDRIMTPVEDRLMRAGVRLAVRLDEALN